MASLVYLNKNRYKLRWPLASQPYVFFGWPLCKSEPWLKMMYFNWRGRIDPPDRPEIMDRNSCIVVVFEPKFQAYVRYYLSRFKIDSARISKTYSDQQISYVLEIQGDDIVVEHLRAHSGVVESRGFPSVFG